MKIRLVMQIAACAIVAVAVLAAAVPYASISPSSVLVYSRPDEHGALTAAIARSRAWFWPDCPRNDFSPTTPLGAVIAAMDDGPTEREQSLLALARTMLEKGCGINDYSRSGTTPLMDAVIFGNPRSVRSLLELGADRSLRKQPSAGRGASPIDGMNAPELAAFLLDRPASAHADRRSVHEALGGPARYTLFAELRRPYESNRAELRKMLKAEGHESFDEGEREVALALTAEQLRGLFQAHVRYRRVEASATRGTRLEAYLEDARIPERYEKLIQRVYFDPQRG